MQNARPVTAHHKQSPGLIKFVGNVFREILGQLATARFWKNLFMFTVKTAFQVGKDMAVVAAGHALIRLGSPSSGGDPEIAAIREKFGPVGPQVLSATTPAPTPAAAAFARGFNPNGEYRGAQYANTPPPQGDAWPGLQPTFSR